MDELVDDMLPIIFQYLSQNELINIFFLSKKINKEVIKYINKIPIITEFNLFNEKHKYNFAYLCSTDCIISIRKYIKYRKQIKFNNNRIWTKCLYFAYRSNNAKYIKLMLKLGANCSDIFYTCRMSNNIYVMKIIFEYYYDIRKITISKKNDDILKNLCHHIFDYAFDTNNIELQNFIHKYLNIIEQTKY